MPAPSRRSPMNCRVAAGSIWCALDPAATARSSLGPAAYSEYERVFGSRILARWPQHLVLDGLDTIELLLDTGNLQIHPRCTRLEGGVPQLLPPAPRGPVDRLPGRRPSGRRHDGRPPRRHSRRAARRQRAGAAPAARAYVEDRAVRPRLDRLTAPLKKLPRLAAASSAARWVRSACPERSRRDRSV